MENKEIPKIVGYVLLTPPLLSVLLFLGQFLTGYDALIDMSKGYGWTGNTSPLPIYFGLMAIAGAYLIKDHKK